MIRKRPIGPTIFKSKFVDNHILVPGSQTPSLWISETEAVIDGGTSQVTAKPMARWGNEMYQTTEGKTTEVFVVADHIEGINYVAFSANGGAEIQVSTPETIYYNDAINETTTIVAYKATVDLSSVTLGEVVEIRARVRPNHGTERILQQSLSGDDLLCSGENPRRRSGQFGSFVTRLTEKVINHTSGDIMTLINSETITSTEQLVIQLGTGLIQWGDTGATANTIAINGVERPIVIRGVDTSYSSIVTNSSTTDMTSGRTKELSLRFEDLEFRNARLDLATNSNLSTANYVVFSKCYLNQQWDNITPLDNYTYTDPNGDTQFLGGEELTLPGNGELCLVRVRDDSGNFYGVPVVAYSTAGASYGYYIMECIGDFQCNAATTLVRNYVHRDGVEDATNNDCFINLKVRGGGRGNYKNFKLINETLIWDNSTTSFADNTTILVKLDASPDGLDTDGGVPASIPVRARWRCYKNNSGAAMTFDPTSAASVELWTDASPHVDASQPSELKNSNGDYVAIDNSMFYGLDVDASNSLQPRISRNANWETNSLWKNWNIDAAYDTSGVNTGRTVNGIVHYSNGAEFASQLLSYVYQHKDHWVVDNVIYDFGTRDTSKTSGSPLFNYNDSGNRGWGNVPPMKTFNSCIRDATWKNSAFKLIQIGTNDWSLNDNTSLGPNLSDFKAYVVDGTVVQTNNPLGQPTLVGNSWAIDALTLANSSMGTSVDPPATANFSTWLNMAVGSNGSIQWTTATNGGSFINQIPLKGLNKIELYDNEGTNKRGIKITFDGSREKEVFNASTSILTVAITVEESNHVNKDTTYTYSWDMNSEDFNWGSNSLMMKWIHRNSATIDVQVPNDSNDNLYGDNPSYEVSIWNGVDNYGTFTQLRELIDNTPDNGILDLGTKKYGATPSDFAKITILKNITITNGTISGSMFLKWTPFQGPENQYRVTGIHDNGTTENYDDPTAWLIDENAVDYPVLAVWPPPEDSSAKYPLTFNKASWVAMRGINDDGGPTDLGDVNTDKGDNNKFGVITGFTITDDELKQTLNTRFASLDTTISNLSIFMHAGPNVVGYAKIESWDASTGVCVFVPGSNNSALKHASSDYFEFILMGDTSFINGNGQYVIDQANNSVVYQPSGSLGGDARISLATEMIRTGPEYNVTFDNLTLSGNRGGEFWIVAQAANPDKIGRLTMTNCDVRYGCAGINSYATIQDSNFRQMQYRGVAGSDGIIVERCLFDDIVNKSAIAVLPRSSVETADVPVEMSIIKDCKFSMPSAVHGQGISLYNSGWQNSTIEHNIFINCDRPMSFQPEGTESNRRTTPGIMIYQNNLMILNENFYAQAGGQQSIAFNGSPDTHIIGTQNVIFRSNTLIGNPDIMFDYSESRVRFGIEIRKLYNSVTKIENNLVGSINAVHSFDSLQPHQHANNFQTFSADLLYGQSYPSTDTINNTGSGVNQDVWINYSTLQPTGAATTGASDGGAVGIRWNSIPTLDQILSADKTWAITYSATEVPIATTTEDAWFQNIPPIG